VDFLITFNSTTASFKGDKLIANMNKGVIHEIISVPYKLSETCYGLGLKVSCDKELFREIFKIFNEEEIDYKRFWLKKEDEYVNITSALKEGENFE